MGPDDGNVVRVAPDGAGPAYSIAWRAMADGSRPANTQPTIAAKAGMPRRRRSRSATGMFPSAAITAVERVAP